MEVCMEYVLLAIGVGFFSGLSILIMVRAHQLKEMPRNTSAQVKAGFMHLSATLRQLLSKLQKSLEV
jgi:hypothetical protein